MTSRERLKELKIQYSRQMERIEDGKATAEQQEKVLKILGEIQFLTVRVMLFGNETLES